MGCKCENCGGVMTGLHHIGVRVNDMEVSKAFYLDTLGLKLLGEFSKDKLKLVFVGVGSCVLELINNGVIADKRPAGVIDHVAIQVEDIEPLVCKLTEKHVAFDTGKIDECDWIYGGVKNIFFKGPDGERIEFFEVLG